MPLDSSHFPHRMVDDVGLVTSDNRMLAADLILVEGAVGAVVLCHPHPLYGGDRHHPLLSRVATRLAEAGWNSIRFDFRRESGDVNESIPDLRAAYERIRSDTSSERIAVVGYSFGALVGLAAEPLMTFEQLVLIAPPLPRGDKREVPACPTRVIVGRHDQFCDPDCLLTTPLGQTTDVTIVEGTDHFLSGYLDAVAATATRLVTEEAN